MLAFNDLANGAASGSKAAIRALQAWQILISKATNRQTVRYDEIAAMMGYSDSRALSPILGQITYLCHDESLPPLTLIVVNQAGGPGAGLTGVARADIDRRREEVFGYDWFGRVPPTIAEFQDAHRRHELIAKPATSVPEVACYT